MEKSNVNVKVNLEIGGLDKLKLLSEKLMHQATQMQYTLNEIESTRIELEINQ